MRVVIPAYYLILSTANIAVLTFAYGKIFTPIVPAVVSRRKGIVERLGWGKMSVGVGGGARSPFPRGGHEGVA